VAADAGYPEAHYHLACVLESENNVCCIRHFTVAASAKHPGALQWFKKNPFTKPWVAITENKILNLFFYSKLEKKKQNRANTASGMLFIFLDNKHECV
jgi:hypothetical protein